MIFLVLFMLVLLVWIYMLTDKKIDVFMKKLDTDIRMNGFDHHQVWREGGVAIYRKTKVGHERDSFEVIKVQQHDGFTISGKEVLPAEYYPGAGEWGENGWTCLTREDAMKKAMALLNPQSP